MSAAPTPSASSAPAPAPAPALSAIPFGLWSEAPEAFAARLGAAFRETGFAVVSGHTVSDTVIEDALAAAKRFFALPAEHKERYHQREGRQRGYTPFATENAKGADRPDLKEFWHTGRALRPGSPLGDRLPPTPSVPEVHGFDAATRALFDALDGMGRELLQAVALHLGLVRDWFDPKVAEGNSILRLLHYPPQGAPPPEGSVRAAAHEDINLITLLLGAEEAGLQVKHRTRGWIPVDPPPGALVVNAGDMLQRFTGGVLPSTSHRVVNPKPDRAARPRYSMPFFLHLEPDVVITKIDTNATREGRAGPPITAQGYLEERLREIGLL